MPDRRRAMIAGAARDGSTTSVPLRRIIPVVVAVVTGRLSKKSARARDSPIDVSLHGPTYHENSHASHTWPRPSHQTPCFKGPEAPPVWVRFPSPAPLSIHVLRMVSPPMVRMLADNQPRASLVEADVLSGLPAGVVLLPSALHWWQCPRRRAQ